VSNLTCSSTAPNIINWDARIITNETDIVGLWFFLEISKLNFGYSLNFGGE
jgi:hypothetical protein